MVPFKFAILFVVFMPVSVSASCPSGVDPYEEVANAFENSDLVFYGHTQSKPEPFRSNDLTIVVDRKWKGPELESIRLKSGRGKPEPSVKFASRSQATGDWHESTPSCFFPYDGLTIEGIVLELYGDPHPPKLGALFRLKGMHAGILLLAVGGIAFCSWSVFRIKE